VRCSEFLLMGCLLMGWTQVVFSQAENASVQNAFSVIDQKYYSEIKEWLLQQNDSLPSVSIITMGFEDDPEDPSVKKIAVIILGKDNQPEKRLFTVDNDFYLKYSETEEKPTPVPDAVPETMMEPSSTVRKTRGDPQDGRLYFMINTTSRSCGVYPIGIATLMENTDGRVTAGLSLLSIGASLYGSYAFSHSIELGYGRVEYMNYGGDMGGITIPLLLQTLILPDDELRLFAISSMIGFPLGIFVGSRLTSADNYAYGNASMMTNLSRFAPLYGYGLVAMATNLGSESDGRVASALSLGMIPAGYYIGKKIVGNNDIASGRSIMTLTGGIGGAVSGLCLTSLFEYDEPNLYFASAILGHIGGSFLGFNYHSNLNHTFAQGTFTAVSSLVGIGLGISIPLLASADEYKVYNIAGMLGCWGGFFLGEHLSLSLFEKNRHDSRGNEVSVSFPGLASIPFLVLNQQFSEGKDHSPVLQEQRLEFWSHATLVDVRF